MWGKSLSKLNYSVHTETLKEVLPSEHEKPCHGTERARHRGDTGARWYPGWAGGCTGAGRGGGQVYQGGQVYPGVA